jgi:outer membrane biosynthesis protein TonB
VKKMKIAQKEKMRRDKENEPMAFEFVDAPKIPAPPAREKTKRISDRDAQSQDMIPAPKPVDGGDPAIKNIGIANELAQRQGNGAAPRPQQEPSPLRMAQAPMQPMPAPPEAPKEPAKTNPQAAADAAETVLASPAPPQPVMPQSAQSPQTASPMVPPVAKSSPGSDKITTEEMARSKSVGAQLFGITSFQATGSGMGVYMKNLKEKIWLAWYPYLAFKYPQDFKGADAVVSFSINAEGKLTMVKTDSLNGSPIFAAFCVDAVQRAAPGFGPVPPEILALIGKDQLEIKFGFHYR